MKKLIQQNLSAGILAVLLIALGLAGQSAVAVTLPFYDEFPSSLGTGNLGTNGVDATSWSLAAGTAGMQVGAFAQTYPGLQSPSSGSQGVRLVNTGVAQTEGGTFTAISSGSVYASFLLKVTTKTSGNRIIYEMHTSSAGNSSTAPGMAIFLDTNNKLGLFKGSTTSLGTTANALTVGAGAPTYLVVVRYTFNAGNATDDTMDLWLNPDPSSFSGTIPTADIAGVGAGATDATSLRTFWFGLFTTSGGAYDLDEVRLGTTWASVTPGVSTSQSTVVASPTSVAANGISASTVTITVKDANGNPMPNIPANKVVVSATGAATVTQPSSATDVNGQTTATVVDGTVQSSTVSVAVYGFGITQTASVNFTGSAPAVTTQSASSQTTTSAILNGTVTGNGGGTITDYGFYWSTSPTVTTNSTKLQVGTDNRSGTFSNSLSSLSLNTPYYYRSYAVNAAGTTIGSSDVTFYTLANTPGTPTVNNATASSLDVTINANGNPTNTTFAIQETTTGNYVQAGGALGASAVYQTLAAWGTPKTVTGLNGCGATYTFRVIAQNGDGTNTAFSSTASGTTTSASVPSAPTAAAATIGTNTFTANWAAASGATNYILDVATDSGFTSFVSGFNGASVGTVTNFVVAVPSAGTYYYRVRAANCGGTGSNSSTITAVVTLGQIVQTLPFYDSFTYSPATSGTGLGLASTNDLSHGGGADQYVWFLGNTTTAIILYTNTGLNSPVGFTASTGGGGASSGSTTVRSLGTLHTTQTAVDGATVYYSFLYSVGTTPAAAAAIASFSSTKPVSSVVAQPGTAGTIMLNTSRQIGINQGGGSAGSTTYGPTLSLNTTYLVVAAYTFHPAGNDTVKLWVSPASSTYGVATAPTADVTVTASGSGTSTNQPSLSTFVLNNEGSRNAWDEVRIGTSWASVTPCVAPAAPTTPTAASANNQVTISWTGSANATGYNVKRSTTSGSGYVTLGAGANVAGSPFVDTTAINGNTYYYVVSALTGGCESSDTTEVVGTPATATAPLVTTQVPNLTNTTSATLAGTITSDGGSAITDSGFYWKTSPGVSTSDTQLSSGNTSVGAFTQSLTGLSVNTIYYYRAYAVNVIGTGLGLSDVSFYTLANTPNAPTVNNLTRSTADVAIASGDGNPSATVYAIQDANTGNYVQANGSLGVSAVYLTASTWGTKTVTNLTSGTSYSFQVKAQNGAGVDTAFGSATSVTTTSDYRAVASGNWSDATTWETNSGVGGTTWSAATTFPGAANNVYIQSGYMVTLTANQSCANLNLCTGTAAPSPTELGQIALGTFTLSVNGKLRAYTGTVGTIPGTSSVGGFSIYPFTASTGGKVSMVGNTRNITDTGEWGPNVTTVTTGVFPLEIALNSGQTLTVGALLKASSWTFASGTYNSVNSRIATDGGVAGTGDVTIKSGATVISAQSGTAGSMVMSRTTGSRGGTLTIESGGKLQLSGTAPTLDMNAIVNNGTIEYVKTSGQNLLAPDGSDASSAPITNYFNLTVNGAGVKTNLANITVNGALTLTTGNLAVGTNTLTLNGTITGTPANLTATSSSSLAFNGSSAITVPGSVTSLRNLTVGNSGGVTLGAAVTLAGQLQVNSGTLALTGASTASSLSFNSGANVQAAGTWGNTGSGATNIDATRFASTGTVTVLYGSDAGTQFRTTSSGNWTNAAIWEVSSNGTTWASGVGIVPSTNNSIYLQAAHIVTLSGNQACSNLDMAYGTTAADTGATGSQLNFGSSTLQLNGRLRAYYGAVATGNTSPVGTDLGVNTATSWSPFLKTAATTGKLQIVGTSRALTASGQWTAFAYASSVMADCDMTLSDTNQTVTMANDIKMGTWTFTVGTMSTTGFITADNGQTATPSLGAAITIGPNAKVITSMTGSNASFRRSTTVPFGTMTVQGLLQFTGTTPLISASAFDFSAGTVEFAKSGSQTLVANHGDTGAATPDTYGNLKISGTGTKTLAADTTVNGSLTLAYVNGTPTLAVPDTKTLTLNGSAVTVTVSGGTPLTNGSYVLASKGASGGVSGTVGALTLAGAGVVSGSTTTLAINNSQLVLNVVTATNVTYSRGKGIVLKIHVADLLANVSVLSGNTFSLASVSTTTNFQTITNSGGLLVVPAETVNDSFTYTVTASPSGATATGTITVNAVDSSGQTSASINTTGGNPNLTFYGIPGASYTIQVSTNLSTWTDVTTVTAGGTGVIAYTDAAPPTPAAYYRTRYNP